MALQQDFFVELDVVMNADTPLWKAHDIAERLQDKIEALPGVERAFVHVDHETSHAPVRSPSSCASGTCSSHISSVLQEHSKYRDSTYATRSSSSESL